MREQEPRPSLEKSAETNPRVAEALGLLQAGFDEIATSEGFQKYLRTMSKFHSYSMNNTLLIMMQRPDASRVAGYSRWQDLGRQVRKGEKAIKIFAPILVKDKTERDEFGKPVEHLVGYTIANVFDIKSTDGEPLPEPPHPERLEGSSAFSGRFYDGVKGFMEGQGIKVVRERFPEAYGTANGIWKPMKREIGISHRLYGDQAAKTIAHEASHALADHRGIIPKEDAEAVAEGSAFVTCNYFGIDTSSYSFPYIAHWAASRQTLSRNINEVQKVSHQLIEGVDKQLKEVVIFDAPREMSRDERVPNSVPPHLRRTTYRHRSRS